MKKNNWIKKEDKKGKIIWRKGRASGLKESKGRIGDITKNIKELLKKKKRIKILEIGAGYGTTLLELKTIFRKKIETFRTNYEKDWNQKLTNEYALSQDFSKDKIPKIYIKIDAGKKLPFRNKSFDFVFCQATMQYIIDRALFIEEVNRILTNQGIAVLELQEYRSDHPKKYENLIEVWNNDKKIDFLKYLKKFKNIRIKKSKDRDWHYIIMRKAKKLDLSLKLIRYVDLEKDFGLWGKKVIYIKK